VTSFIRFAHNGVAHTEDTIVGQIDRGVSTKNGFDGSNHEITNVTIEGIASPSSPKPLCLRMLASIGKTPVSLSKPWATR
jgi:hypothetical protein